MNTHFKLSSKKHKPEKTCVKIGNICIGNGAPVVIAGPCTVESYEVLLKTAASIKNAGAKMLRGGAYKSRTSPHSFQGLGVKGLKMLAEVRGITGLPIVTEITNPNDVGEISEYADMLQIGSRNMQNTALLIAVGRGYRPVLLKRGFGCTVSEWLAAADYVLGEGNTDVVLCERGIRTFETSTRFSLDILSVPVLKQLSHLPLIVDPSHASGSRDFVPSAAKAAIAAGADGLLLEVSSDPEEAMVDGEQTITTDQFGGLMSDINKIIDVLRD